MSGFKRHAAQLAAETAELAADVRRQDEAANDRQRAVWLRNADRPEREKKSRAARGLDAFLRACKFTPDEIVALRPALWVVLKAADGADLEEYFVLPDAVAGAMLEDWPAADIEDLRRRGKGHPDADRLARAWVRAVGRCDLIFARAGLKLFDRKHGFKSATGNVASKVCAPFVQSLVDVDKTAASLRVRSIGQRYQRAAELVVKDLPRYVAEAPPGAFKCPACQSDNCPHARTNTRRPPKEKTAADRCVNFLHKLPEMVDRMLADVPAELRADLYEPARKLLQARLTGEVEDDGAAPERAENDHAGRTEAAKNAGADEIRVDKNVTQKSLTAADWALYARAVQERAAELERERGLSFKEAEAEAMVEFGSAERWAVQHLRREARE